MSNVHTVHDRRTTTTRTTTSQLTMTSIAQAARASGGSEIAAIFNSAVAAWALAAAWELGALDELRAEGELDAEEFAARGGLDPTATVGMFRALASVGVVERHHTLVTPAVLFDEAYQYKSFFHWLSRGSSELFSQMPTTLVNANRVGQFYQRDSAAIAYACREINELCYDEQFWAAMDRGGSDFSVVADLGCGSGGRIMDVLTRYPGTRGIGIDIARPAVEAAREQARRVGLADRATFVEADVLSLEPRPEFQQVELVTCFMMGHDFWPRERCVPSLRRLRSVFPAARRFLLGDATRTIGIPDAELPVFTLGFELGHDLMGAVLPTIDDWEGVFAEAGWELQKTNRIEMTVGEVIFELC